ncbi:MAG: DotU family type IV/VI secretion system protein [Xanthomonadaceae bacterium]|nr:DotU family type IV/VI secretion system protein [Xanthomonadaceae bacterium]
MSCFADFYEEVARIKLAVQRGELARLLQPQSPHVPIEPRDQAERVANRLLAVLDRQSHAVAAVATDAEMEAYRRTRYVMAALADEIFILNLSWPGTEFWTEYMLEYALYRTRVAGRRFFDYVQELMGCRDRSPLDADFAAVLLLALQLGFQGMYRGSDRQNKKELGDRRSRLYPMATGLTLEDSRGRMFPQAYDYTVASSRDNSRIALAPWVRATVYGALGYLLISSIVWLALTWSLLRVIGGAV